MSRIGNTIISVPDGVKVSIDGTQCTVTGEKGTLTVVVPAVINVAQTAESLTLTRQNELKPSKALHGTMRALLANAVTGVKDGWVKKLEIHGSGYRAAVTGEALDLVVGYSHLVALPIPAGLEVKVVKHVITVSGIDKQAVGAFAANIRAVRKPEPYKGKGIKYQTEHIIRKVGKALKASA